VSERNYNSAFNPSEAYSQDSEADAEKTKKEKEEAEKKRKKQRKQADKEHQKNDSFFDKKSEQEKPDAKRASVFDKLLGVDKKESEPNKKKLQHKGKDDTAKSETATTSPERTAHTAGRSAEQTTAKPEQLDDAEAIEATQTYIAARSAQLEAEANQDSSAATNPEDQSPEEKLRQSHANLGFLQALKRSLTREKTAPNEEMLEASLQEATGGQVAAEDDASERVEATVPDNEAPAEDTAEVASATEATPLTTPSHPASGELQSDGVVHLSAIEPDPSAPERPDNVGPVVMDHDQFGGNSAASAQEFSNASTFKPSIERTQPRTGAGEFLLGGFVGYLLGKRRGRIKTEKELEPVRTSLEGQVTQLEQTIRAYEARARASVSEQRATPASAKPASEQANATETAYGSRQKPAPAEVSASADETEQKPEISSVKDEPDESEDSFKRAALEHSESLARSQETTAEQISRLGISREGMTQQSDSSEGEPDAYRSARRDVLTPERVDTTATAALLNRAESIRYNNQSLRTLYERGEVSDRVLRGALKEHLRGNRIDMYLDKELEKTQASTEAYNPETAPGNSSARQFSDNNAINTDTKSSAALELPPVSFDSQQHDVGDSGQPKNVITGQSQSQKMKQAGLGAVLGLILVLVLWFLLSGSSLI